MSFLRLFNRFILRALLREKTRSIVAALGVGLGVAVMLAIRLANISVTETFRAAVDSVSGNTSVQNSRHGRTIRRATICRTRSDPQLWTPESGHRSLRDGGRSGSRKVAKPTAFHEVRSCTSWVWTSCSTSRFATTRCFGLGDAERQSAREALRLLDDSTSVILTEKFLRRHAAASGGSTFRSLSARRHRDFTIRGVLLDRGPAQTLDGNFALMDIAAAQLAANRLGLLDHVDVLLRPEFDAEQILPTLQQQLPEGLVAELPDATSGRADTMIAAFQFNLTALSAVALIVGLFLIYNTVAMSVAARRAEIGMLQAVGAGDERFLDCSLLRLCCWRWLASLLGFRRDVCWAPRP